MAEGAPATEYVSLSARDARIVKLLADGNSEREIAERLHLPLDVLRADLDALTSYLQEAAGSLTNGNGHGPAKNGRASSSSTLHKNAS